MNEKDKYLPFKKDLSTCVNIQNKTYYDNQLITNFQHNKKQIFYIIHGKALIMKNDIDGNKVMLRDLKENDIFSYLFYKNFDDEIYVVNNSSVTEIAIIDYSKIVKDCPKNCPFHNKLVSTLYELLIEDNRQQNEKIELLSQKSVRDKINFFLRKRMNDKNIFKVTTSYKAIAEYINVDRSNFMRELNKMEKENLIKRNGRIIIIMDDN